MERSYKYAVIRAEPDPIRGERVNVGLAVFGDRGVQIQSLDASKLSALTSISWTGALDAYERALKVAFDRSKTADAARSGVNGMFKSLNLSDLGTFIANDSIEYESEIQRITRELIARPRARRERSSTSIAAEVLRDFKAKNILAAADEGIESGRVVKNFSVDPVEGLTADFAIQNGHLNLAVTLDLRLQRPQLGQAALKAVTIDKAKKLRSDGEVQGYALYAAVSDRVPELREHIEMLGDYSDGVFNWLDSGQRSKFQRLFYDAYNSHHPTPIA
jgi:hypothetical protein